MVRVNGSMVKMPACTTNPNENTSAVYKMILKVIQIKPKKFLLYILVFLCSCKTYTPLVECLKAIQNKSFFGKQIQDTAFLKGCDRYHRAELIDRLTYEKKYMMQNGRYVLDGDNKPVYYLVPAKKQLSLKEKLFFIESGRLIPK